MKDMDDLVTTNGSQAFSMNWTVSISKFRPDAVRATGFTKIGYTGTLLSGFVPTFINETVQLHNPLMSGTFTMMIGAISVKVNNVVDIPYNVWEGTL